MQNFTLGKKGISMLLFAFILLTGSLPSFGQECPTVTASNQTFCDSTEPQISDLNAQLDAEGETIAWYISQESTVALPSTQILQNNTTYYAGTSNVDCTGRRAPVNVTIYSEPEITGIRATTPTTRQSLAVLGICVADVNNPNVFVSDLRTNYDNVDDVRVVWYLNRTSNQPLDENAVLINNTDYFAGLQVLDPNDNSIICETNRRRTTVRFYTEDAPTGEASQTFCASNNPTLADIVATGNNRFYNSPTSAVELASNTPLTAGTTTTYYVASIGEFCESVDRLAVTVTVPEAEFLGPDVAGSFCLAQIQARLANNESPTEIFLSLFGEREVPQNGTFNPSINQIAQSYNSNPIGTFTTVYTVTNEAGCEDQVELSLIITEDVNAGEDVVLNICSSELQNPEALIAQFLAIANERELDGEGFDQEELGALSATFNPNNPAGSYSATYTVGEGDCVDSFLITINVQEGEIEELAPIATSLCEEQINNPTVEGFTSYLNNLVTSNTGLPTGGTFEPSIEELIEQFDENSTGTFNTRYSYSENECDSTSVAISVEVRATEEANAGTIANIEDVCPSADVIVLNTLLSADATRGGTFTAAAGTLDENGNFDPSIGAGTYTITYTIDENTACVTGGDSTTFTITVVEGPNAGPDVSLEYCITEVENMTPPQALAIFNNLVGDDVDQTGTFSPSLEVLLGQFLTNRIGTFTTTYTVEEDGCVNTAVLTVVITDTVPADAGEIEDFTACASDASLDLFAEVGVSMGTFYFEESGDVIENGMLDVSTPGALPTILYVVSEDNGDCVEGEDSTSFIVNVAPAPNAGSDNTLVLCDTQVPARNGVTNLYLSLLDEGVATDGTFSPALEELIDRYNNVSRYGDFTTTYTVTEGECTDSTVLTVRVQRPITSGQDRNLTFCATEGPVNLFSYLANNVDRTGTFEGYEDGMFDPSTVTAGESITINYNITGDESTCVVDETAVFTINVIEPQDANAGGDVDVTYCIDQDENIQLTSLLGEGALATGSFSAPYQNGIFNPATAGAGEYVITYTINGEEDCAIGTDSATITINVNANSEGPEADAEQIFCLGDDSTVADLQATGENIVWYTDAALTTPANPTTILTDGAVFYAVDEANNACGTPSTMVTVVIGDSATPTIQTNGNEFCRADNPTVAELLANLSGNDIQIYTEATGGTPLAATTALQNGTTYYATSRDAAVNCESSERLAINVRVAFCGIPEAFSPNGDNINDTFVIPDIRRDYPNFTLEVFNRWGNVVFKGNAGTPDWDGVSNQSATLGDKVLPAGVYFYILNYNDGQTSPVQGKVYLSR